MEERELTARIKGGCPSGLYFFYGDEDFTKNRRAAELRKAAAGDDPSFAAFNAIDLFFGEGELDLGAIRDAVSSPPLMSSFKAVTVSHSALDSLKEKDRTALIDLKDISQTVGSIIDTLNDDPAELARVDSRLNDIYALERKHNAQDVNQLLDIQRDYERQLGEIEHNDDIIEQLKAQVSENRAAAMKLATQLSARRHDAARHFGKELLELATPLGMKNIAFDVEFKATDLTSSGIDSVDFMMAFNKNQHPMPVKDTASGGEISRVMLCIKTIIARHMQLPSIIFDEVDTGVSGDIANMIGEMMADIARSIQVIAITHLPQVAANGDHHLRVFKTDTAVETLTRVESLDQQEHIMEIARMLSGKDLNQAAIENAKSLIQHNHKDK